MFDSFRMVFSNLKTKWASQQTWLVRKKIVKALKTLFAPNINPHGLSLCPKIQYFLSSKIIITKILFPALGINNKRTY